MLRQVYILFFLFLIQSCKSEDAGVMDADFVSVSGTWRLIEIEKGSFGQKFWEATGNKPAKNLIFREDGAILDSDSLAVCCGPTSLLINGQFFEIKPQQTVVVNPICAVVNCTSCPTWEITWNGNQMIITYCDGSREKYTK